MGKKQKKCLNVLLIDDDASEISIFQQSIKIEIDLICNIKCYRSISRIEQFMTTSKPDVVFISFNQPELKGIQAFWKMRELFPNAPIVVIVDEDNEEEGKIAVQAGAEDYLLSRAFSRRVIIRVIRYAVKNFRIKHMLKELEDKTTEVPSE